MVCRSMTSSLAYSSKLKSRPLASVVLWLLLLGCSNDPQTTSSTGPQSEIAQLMEAPYSIAISEDAAIRVSVRDPVKLDYVPDPGFCGTVGAPGRWYANPYISSWPREWDPSIRLIEAWVLSGSKIIASTTRSSRFGDGYGTGAVLFSDHEFEDGVQGTVVVELEGIGRDPVLLQSPPFTARTLSKADVDAMNAMALKMQAEQK